LLSSATAATLLGSGWALRSKQRNIVAVVLAYKFHDLVHAGPGIASEGARRSPLTGSLLRVFVNNFVEDVRRTGAGEALDGVKAFAGFLNTANRVLSIVGNGINDQCVAVPACHGISHPCGIVCGINPMGLIDRHNAERSRIFVD